MENVGVFPSYETLGKLFNLSVLQFITCNMCTIIGHCLPDI